MKIIFSPDNMILWDNLIGNPILTLFKPPSSGIKYRLFQMVSILNMHCV